MFINIKWNQKGTKTSKKDGVTIKDFVALSFIPCLFLKAELFYFDKEVMDNGIVFIWADK